MADIDRSFHDGFEQMLSEMPEPPSWERVSSGLAVSSPPRRFARPVWAVAGSAVAVLAVGAVLILLRGGISPVAAETINYVKVEWSDDTELRCLGLEAREQPGFAEATVEIWGPTADGFIRYDATTADGQTHTVIKEEPSGGSAFPLRAWASYRIGWDNESPFRITDCVEQTAGGTSSWAMGQDPLAPYGNSFGLFLIQPDSNDMATLLEGLSDRATVRTEPWPGGEATVYATTNTSRDELGTSESTQEVWVDIASGWIVGWYLTADIEVLGTGAIDFEVIERSEVVLDSELMDTDSLELFHDMSDAAGQRSEGDEPVVTTSIPPLGEDLMREAVEIEQDQIPAELADQIATQPGDQLYLVDIPEGPLYVRLRVAEQAHMYATSCATLLGAELPAEWEGTCLELENDGEPGGGPYSYSEAKRAGG